MLATVSFQELLIIFLIIFLIFGAKRLPELAKSLGKAMNEFKKAKDEILSSDEKDPAADAKARETEQEKSKEIYKDLADSSSDSSDSK